MLLEEGGLLCHGAQQAAMLQIQALSRTRKHNLNYSLFRSRGEEQLWGLGKQPSMTDHGGMKCSLCYLVVKRLREGELLIISLAWVPRSAHLKGG